MTEVHCEGCNLSQNGVCTAKKIEIVGSRIEHQHCDGTLIEEEEGT